MLFVSKGEYNIADLNSHQNVQEFVGSESGTFGCDDRLDMDCQQVLNFRHASGQKAVPLPNNFLHDGFLDFLDRNATAHSGWAIGETR